MDQENLPQARGADYLRPLIKRWWLIVVAVVVATGGVYAYYSHKPNVYTATTLVYYRDPGDPVTGSPSLPSTDRTVANEATLLYGRDAAAAVAAKVGFHGSPQALLRAVSLSSKPGEDFIQVTAQAGGAAQAAAIANAFGGNLVSSLDNGVIYRIQSAIRLTKNELAQLPRGTGSVVQRANLTVQLNRLELSLSVPTTVSRLVNPALPPAAPTSPKPTRNALFALIISLIGAISLCYLLERFDRRLKVPDEMEDAYGRPLLAVLPHAGNPTQELAGEPTFNHEFRDPFRVLRTNLELETLDVPPQTIVVSSAMPGEGKSTVVRNLALALREAGKQVVVVDLDLRHPSQALMFGVGGAPGMTEVLRHEADLDAAIRHIPVAVLPMDEFAHLAVQPRATGARGGHGNGARTNGTHKHPEISLLTSGATPANPAVVIASERIVEVLDELRRRYDIVLIDSAPVLPVSDAVPLLRYADAALFVGRLDLTTRDTAKRLMEFLERVPDLRIIGIVANDLSRLDAGGYGYGYGYGYGEGPGGGPTPARSLRGRRAARRDKQPV